MTFKQEQSSAPPLSEGQTRIRVQSACRQSGERDDENWPSGFHQCAIAQAAITGLRLPPKSAANETSPREPVGKPHQTSRSLRETTHTHQFRRDDAEPWPPAAPSAGGRAATGSHARALPQPVSDPPGVALDAGRLPANANHGNRPHRGGPRSSAAGEAPQRDAEI